MILLSLPDYLADLAAALAGEEGAGRYNSTLAAACRRALAAEAQVDDADERAAELRADLEAAREEITAYERRIEGVKAAAA